MTSAKHAAGGTSPRLAGLVGGLAAWLRRRAADHAARRAGEELARMDDNLLRDIGIDRSDAARFARFGRD